MNLLKDDVRTVFHKYALAGFGNSLVCCIYSMVDIICVGQYGGPDAAAALACVTPAWSFLFCLGLLFGSGGGVRMSISRGEGKREKGDEYFTVTFVIALILSVVITALALIFQDEILTLGGADAKLLPDAREYAVWIFMAVPTFILAQNFGSFIRNDGAPMLCTVSNLVGGGVNIVLDILFVFVFDLGMKGAGLATAIGQLTCLLTLCTYFLRKRCTLKMRRPTRVLRKTWESMQAGFAPFALDISNGIATALFNNQCMRFGGATELAIYGTIANIQIMFQALFNSVGTALQPIVSINHGAGLKLRVQETFRLAMKLIAGMTVLFFLISELLPGQMLRLYMDVTPAVMEIGPRIVRVFALSFLLMGFNIVTSIYLQSILRNRASFLLSVSRGFVLTVTFLFLLPQLFGIDGLWWTMPLTETCTFVIAVLLMRRKDAAL